MHQFRNGSHTPVEPDVVVAVVVEVLVVAVTVAVPEPPVFTGYLRPVDAQVPFDGASI
jgi:hypothetical protein